MKEEIIPYLDQAQYLKDQGHVPWDIDIYKLAHVLYYRKKGKKIVDPNKIDK